MMSTGPDQRLAVREPMRAPVWTGWSAERRLSRGQHVAIVVLVLAMAACVVLLGARVLLASLLGAGTLVFVATTILRLYYITAGVRSGSDPLAQPVEEGPLDLPRYTIMVALYREAEVVPALLDAIERLEYPKRLLQVLLLVEDDDPETERACYAALRPGWELVVVPPGSPKTKPRALNHGLPLVSGELFTIYDAEDRPEPDQLLQAVAEFRRQPSRVAALQAKLDFYNSHQNGLTKWFTCDYASHFGLFLRGVAARGHPVPLGGTSTHFKTSVVRELGGWDAWNVTEDCELGMRLAAAGYDTRCLESVTWEEAVPRLRGWIRQRSRWVKGFTQTALVLLRSPRRTAQAMGVRPYLASLGIVGGTPLVLVTQVIFWALLIVYVGLRISGGNVRPIEKLFPEPLLSLGMVSLLVGNFVVVLAHVTEIYRERRDDLVGWALTVPIYWLLASIAAWKGVLQLISRPHRWEKTQHGLADESAVRDRRTAIPRALPAPATRSNGRPAPLPAALDPAIGPARSAALQITTTTTRELIAPREEVFNGTPARVRDAELVLRSASEPNGNGTRPRDRAIRMIVVGGLIGAGYSLGYRGGGVLIELFSSSSATRRERAAWPRR